MTVRPCSGYAALERGAALVPWSFERRSLRDQDIALRVLFCGICHSDVHAVKRGRGPGRYPLVPGHEIVGEVIDIGARVTRFKTGDRVMVGTIVDSCGQCSSCRDGCEPYCVEGPTTTYGGIDRIDGSMTRGGYSNEYVVDQSFAYRLPPALDPAAAAPLLCAGITTWSPLRHWEIGPNKVVGIIGLGGLGHMALKLARAMGATVVQFTTSPRKAADAYRFGAHEVVLSTDAAQMAAQGWRFDFILDTVSTRHPLTPYIKALKRDATICSLGLPAGGLDFEPVALTYGRRRLSSSGVGGRGETQDMLDFCARHAITSDIELVAPDGINTAFDRLERNDVRYRFVIDMARKP
jgi:alcohol dehydrogenase (NADP+)